MEAGIVGVRNGWMKEVREDGFLKKKQRRKGWMDSLKDGWMLGGHGWKVGWVCGW